jgi:hypothetical protein
MFVNNRWYALIALLTLLSVGCSDFGEVEQGLVIAAQGNEVALVLDSNPKGDARYDRVPAVTVRLPADPGQMGPAPAVGKLIRLDTEASEIVIYSVAEASLVTVPFELVEHTGGVYPDDARVVASGAPKVDTAAQTVTLYAPRTREIATIKVPNEYLSLPADTWQSGDEIRYYFKDPGQALRMMNVSQNQIR